MNPDFSKGLVPAVVQDAASGLVLMVAYMDDESWSKTRESGRAWFHSRERGLWEKGATSGNFMEVVDTRLDCDLDAILLRVRPAGPACHTGEVSCFFNAPD
jgi:phosphoribosyl-ATP pyrophosphohydrolase/phosphoribosyl-AMP cyclohydrolase